MLNAPYQHFQVSFSPYFNRNIQSIYQTPPGGKEPDWFYVITVQTDLDFVPALHVSMKSKNFYL